MGCSASSGPRAVRTHKDPPSDNVQAKTKAGHESAIHMIICTLDYAGTQYVLTSSKDGQNMLKCAELCNITCHVIQDHDCTKENVLALIKKVGGLCGPDGYFIFYYAGHGAQLPDQDGDEMDGMDECLVLVDEHGKPRKSAWLRDDDFALAVGTATEPEVRVIVITDCCHSGTIADPRSPVWEGRKMVCLSGCSDKQESGDTGMGGIFTHCLLLSIDRLKLYQDSLWRARKKRLTLQQLHKEIEDCDKHIFSSLWTQTIKINRTRDECMIWPLVPVNAGYHAPIRSMPVYKLDFKRSYKL